MICFSREHEDRLFPRLTTPDPFAKSLNDQAGVMTSLQGVVVYKFSFLDSPNRVILPGNENFTEWFCTNFARRLGVMSLECIQAKEKE
jgi:hypothetical protein